MSRRAPGLGVYLPAKRSSGAAGTAVWVEYGGAAGHPRVGNEVGQDPTDEANELGARSGAGRSQGYLRTLRPEERSPIRVRQASPAHLRRVVGDAAADDACSDPDDPRRLF